VLAVLVVLALGRAAWLGQPVWLEPAADTRLRCLSYAPFRDPGTSPFDPAGHIEPARIEADLRLLSTTTRCVRTYAVDMGLEAVPEAARRAGMTVILGAWVGRDRAANAAQVAQAVALARAYPDVVHTVVVGNEVLLRRELPESELRELLLAARAALPAGVRLTYADVWEFWLRHRSLLDAVDRVTVHLLPYWEDEPVGIDRAVGHVFDTLDHVRAELPGRDLLIGEVGWPSAGRARRDAVPGRVAQARFIREFTGEAAARGVDYNLIEAFDQPWKRALEGAMGGAWGLFDRFGQPKFALSGPVVERPDWQRELWAAAVGALAGAGVLGWLARRSGRRVAAASASTTAPRAGAARAAAVGALAGAGLGAMAIEQTRHLLTWNRWPLEWGATLLATGAVWVFAGVAAWLIARPGGPGRLPCAAHVVVACRRTRGSGPSVASSGVAGRADIAGPVRALPDGPRDPAAAAAAVLFAAVLFAAAVTVLLHAFDARYRGFDWPLFAPAAGAAVLLSLAGAVRMGDAAEERLLAVVLAAGAVVMLVAERPWNPQAVLYASLMLVLAVFAWPRTSASAPSSAPTAAGSGA
jgi:exo-beta-1,3-glucanase (GH17 family)